MMRKHLVVAAVAGTVGLAYAAGPTPDERLAQYSAQGRAYLTYDFGGPRRALNAPMPFHYGLRIDSESRLANEAYYGVVDRRVPSVLQLDFAADGSRLASLNGVPFAGRTYFMRQNDGSTAPSGGTGEPGGFTWFDWGLLAVGVGGAGYLIAEVAKGKDDPDPPASNSTTGGGGGLLGGTTTGGLLGGTSGGTTTGGLLGSGLLGGYAGRGQIIDEDREAIREQIKRDGGHGQMGDLGG